MTNHRHYARTRLSLRTRSSRRSVSCGGGVSFNEKTRFSSSTFCHDSGKISIAVKEPHVSADNEERSMVSSTECGMESSLLSDARMEACNDDQIRDAAGLLMFLRTNDGIFLDDDTSTSDQHPPPQNKKSRTATTTGDSLTSIPTITPCVVSSPLIRTAAERTRLLSGSSISLADTAWSSTGAAAVVASSIVSSTVSTTNKNYKKKTKRLTVTKGRSPITKKKRGPGRPPKKRGRPAGRGRTSIIMAPPPSAVTTISSSVAVVAPTLDSPSSSRENVVTATDAPVAAAAGRVASSTTTRTTLRLSTPEDPSNLSQLHCFVRSNLLELVVLQDDDKKTRQNQDNVRSDEHPVQEDNNNTSTTRLQLFDQRRSPNPPPRRHRVGLRCVYCAQVEEEEFFGVDDRHCKSSACGSSSSSNNNNKKIRLPTRTMHPFFPKSLDDLYRNVSNWQQFHFSVCQHIPASVRSKYKELKKAKTRGKTAYWVSSARALGLSNAGGRNGICIQQS